VERRSQREPEPQTPQEALRDQVARARVASGAPHAYFGDQLRDALLAAWRADQTLARRKTGRPCSVEVRLVQELSGRLLELEVVRPSCDPSMDEELLANLMTAARNLPAPPPQVTEHRDLLRSTFRFTFVPPGSLPSNWFDLVNLVDRKAIPPAQPKRVQVIAVE
jgi:hypothetical protein